MRGSPASSRRARGPWRAYVLGPEPADELLRELDELLPESSHPVSCSTMRGCWRCSTASRKRGRSRCRRASGCASSPATNGGEHLAEIATLAGDDESAAAYLRVHCDRLEAHHRLNNLSTYAPMLGRSLCALGRYDEAEPLAEQGRELGHEQDLATQALWRQVQARVLAHRGQHAEAEPLAREAVAIIERTDGLNFQGDALCDLAEVLAAAGRSDEAAAALARALERYERKRNLAMSRRVREQLSVLRAR